MSDNQQIIIEHIVNIDTVAQHIDTVDAVAAVSGQIAAVAGMLPDVAATAQARATIIALSKKLTEITAVSEALPLLHALQAMTEQVTAVIALRPELAAVVGQMSAIQSLAAELDTLMQAPAYAERSEVAAERAEVGATRAESFAGKADSARLGAEFAENEAKTARDTAVTAKGESETARDDARKAAAAAEAVSGLPDASLAVPGDPLIWNGSKFAVGALAESLVSMDGALGVAPAVLTSIDTAKTTADGAASVAAQAQADAATALTIAEGVDGKAGQALKGAAEAKTSAEAAGALTESFEGRLTTAETETQNVGAALSAHAGTSDIHTPKADIEAMAESAANRLKDGGDGATLPADRDTLLKLSGIIDEVGSSLADFLGGEEPGKRMAILAELDRISAELSGLSTGGLTRADVVNSLDSDAQDAPLAAAQGPVLKQMVDNVRDLTQAALRPWVLVVQSIPETWPEAANPDGLLLRYTVADDKITNPEWYRSVQGKPTKLVTDASGIRLADGTTVQSAVGQIKIDAEQASAAATSAAASAAQAQEDAATAKTVAEGVDAKATQAQTDAAAAKAEAANANTVAEGVDAKATQAQTDAAAAKAEAANANTVAEGVDAKATQALEDAAEALAKSPDLATQTTPGIVKGSDTVEIGEDGSVNVVGGAGGSFIGQIVDIPAGMTLPFGYYQMNGDTFNLSSPQGVVLNSFSDDFKTNFRISLGVSSELIVDRYPAMTSDSDPAPFKCRSSSAYGPQYAAWKAFNKRNIDGYDGAVSQAGNRSIVLEFSNGNSNSGDRLARYDICSRNDPLAVDRPDRWTLYVGQSPDFGVNDYAALDTVVGQENGWAYNTLRSYNIYDYFKKPVFGKVKFEFSRTQTGNDYIAVGGIKLYTVRDTEGVEKFINVPDWRVLYPANLPLTNLKKCIFLGV